MIMKHWSVVAYEASKEGYNLPNISSVIIIDRNEFLKYTRKHHLNECDECLYWGDDSEGQIVMSEDGSRVWICHECRHFLLGELVSGA